MVKTCLFEVAIILNNSSELNAFYETRPAAKEQSLRLISDIEYAAPNSFVSFVDDAGTRFHIKRSKIVAVVMGCSNV